MSGVTARTLRHYDETGLLPPARIGANGHHHYGEHHLLLLQVLVLRALGVGLPEIAQILSAQVDEVEALRGHHQRLLAAWGRLAALPRPCLPPACDLQELGRPEGWRARFDVRG